MRSLASFAASNLLSLSLSEQQNHVPNQKIEHPLRCSDMKSIRTVPSHASKTARRRRRSVLARASSEKEPTARNNDSNARRFLVVNYHRQESDYDGFGLHVWGDVKKPTEWDEPLFPTSSMEEKDHPHHHPQFETFKVELDGTNSKIVSKKLTSLNRKQVQKNGIQGLNSIIL